MSVNGSGPSAATRPATAVSPSSLPSNGLPTGAGLPSPNLAASSLPAETNATSATMSPSRQNGPTRQGSTGSLSKLMRRLSGKVPTSPTPSSPPTPKGSPSLEKSSGGGSPFFGGGGGTLKRRSRSSSLIKRKSGNDGEQDVSEVTLMPGTPPGQTGAGKGKGRGIEDIYEDEVDPFEVAEMRRGLSVKGRKDVELGQRWTTATQTRAAQSVESLDSDKDVFW